MGARTITRITPVRDSVDRLEWQLRGPTDFYGTNPDQCFILGWEGRVSFYHQALPSNIIDPGKTPKRTLLARLINHARVARVRMPSEVTLDFSTELPGDSLDRVVRFQNEGPGTFFARIEGYLTLVVANNRNWNDGIVGLFGDMQRMPGIDIRSEPYNLTNEWPQLLSQLRPSGRFLIDER